MHIVLCLKATYMQHSSDSSRSIVVRQTINHEVLLILAYSKPNLLAKCSWAGVSCHGIEIDALVRITAWKEQDDKIQHWKISHRLCFCIARVAGPMCWTR